MLDLEEGRVLVNLARRSIENYLDKGEKLEPPEDLSEEMEKERGVFVTLNKDGELRGCIGRPLPSQPLVKGLIDSAVSAAVGDPRFPSLESHELDDVTVEVSVLTLPQKIDVVDSKKCPEKVEVGKDGLVVKCGRLEGLLLPQVPLDQDWDAEEFLSQTCVKAGLPPDSWLEDDTEIKKFSAQVFKEKEPDGEVVEKSLSG